MEDCPLLSEENKCNELATSILEEWKKEQETKGKDAKLFQEKFSNIKNLSIKNCGAMDTAVKFVYAQAKKGQIILLAPACASTDMYKNYMARGDDFTNNVHLLT